MPSPLAATDAGAACRPHQVATSPGMGRRCRHMPGGKFCCVGLLGVVSSSPETHPSSSIKKRYALRVLPVVSCSDISIQRLRVAKPTLNSITCAPTFPLSIGAAHTVSSEHGCDSERILAWSRAQGRRVNKLNPGRSTRSALYPHHNHIPHTKQLLSLLSVPILHLTLRTLMCSVVCSTVLVWSKVWSAVGHILRDSGSESMLPSSSIPK